MTRRLAAIMAADIVGFSRMMGSDETETLAALHQLRNELLEPEIANHGGTVIKRTGDGWLVEFPSSSEAVNCAIGVQQGLTELPKISLRIGIHIGDVVHDADGDIFGDGVNIACRLEGIAEPGGVAVSDQLYASLEARLRNLFADSGRQQLKNISQPVQVWHWPNELDRHAPAASPQAESDIPIILVEQFTQGGEASDSSDLSQELYGEVVDALSRRVGVRVVTVADTAAPATYILKGRCRVAGKRCRLYMSMTVAANGETFWTTKFDGEVNDIFEFLDEATAKTSAAIRTHINAFAGAIYASRPDETLSVQQLLAKAAFFFYHFDKPNAELSRQTMNVAVTKAPENPMALAMQAFAITQTVQLAIDRAEEVDAEAAMDCANKAVHYGPGGDVIHAIRGHTRLWLRLDHQGCFDDLRRALSINPNYHVAKSWISEAKIFGGDRIDGISELEASIDQIPNEPSAPVRLSTLAIGHALAGNSQIALLHARDAYERKPLVRLHAIAYAVAAAGNDDITGSDEFEDMVRRHDLTVDDATRFPFALRSDVELMVQLLRKAGIE